MEIAFTKMQGAGNDFVVLDQTADADRPSPEQIRFLADRHFGVGADQVLCVRPAPSTALCFSADRGESARLTATIWFGRIASSR